MRVLARISRRGSCTIPREVRAALGVGPGDLLAWEVQPGKKATVRRVQLNLELASASKPRRTQDRR
ncbi:MAG: hypothetical protein KatS3mg076_0397 [Candidatus Binatia bacterium]|nr:MAG: hypothetical protein KatS3mg076_0397 [Candidatus Binatia bacterium]